MEQLWFNLFLLAMSLLSFPIFFLFRKHRSIPSSPKLPPGSIGYPVVGESLAFLSTRRNGHPEKFILDRISRYSSLVFKTSLFGEPMAVFCGAAANKFLFSNQNKLVATWWPRSVKKIFPSPPETSLKEEALRMRKMLPQFFKPEALQRYVGVMDAVTQQHFSMGWENKEQVVVYPLAMQFTFLLACKSFMRIEDPDHVDRLAEPFQVIGKGVVSIPIDLPGTTFHRAMKASKLIRKDLREIIRRRKTDLAEGRVSATQDILSHMLSVTDEVGKHLNEMEAANNILALLIGGHDTTSAACSFVVLFLAKYPEIYEKVYGEQKEIVKSKGRGELLNWDDIQRMRYSWKVACEVMRLAPPVQGTFREALHDFTYDGFDIPKGWKIHWSTSSTHRSAEYFPEPEKFDPSRFEGKGPLPYSYVPFGGGPRMCPGKEYARLEILVFMHNLVKRFRWEKLIPDEKVVVNPIPMPANGLPIRLYPHIIQTT